MSVHASTALVGARLDDNENGQSAGAAYVYEPSLELSILGACPGQVTLESHGAEPHAAVALFGADALGSDDLQVGHCTDAAMELSQPVYLATLSADADGAFSATIDIETPACGLLLQAIELEYCEASNVAQVPQR